MTDDTNELIQENENLNFISAVDISRYPEISIQIQYSMITMEIRMIF